jgi:hypothetical protein
MYYLRPAKKICRLILYNLGCYSINGYYTALSEQSVYGQGIFNHNPLAPDSQLTTRNSGLQTQTLNSRFPTLSPLSHLILLRFSRLHHLIACKKSEQITKTLRSELTNYIHPCQPIHVSNFPSFLLTLINPRILKPAIANCYIHRLQLNQVCK